MPLENVQKIETQEKHEKSWFQRFKNSALATSGLALVGTTSAHAEGEIAITDFITPVKDSFTGIAADLGGLFLVCLGITVLIAVFSISRGGVKKSASS